MKLLSHLRSFFLLAVVAVAQPLLAQRTVTFSVAGNQITASGTAAVVLAAQGTENALGFSVTFNPAVLSYTGFVNGADVTGATVNPNVSQAASGRVGFAIALPSGSKFAAGSRQLVVLNFTVVAPVNSTTLGFGDTPIGREVSDDLAEALAATFTAQDIAASLPPAAPTISTQPIAATVSAGQNASFTVAAAGNPAPTFKWQKSADGTTGWTDVANGGRVSGATTATLTLTGALTADAAFYRAVAANGVTPDANSNAAQLTVNKASQTISFGTIVAKSFGDFPFALGATASSGLPVTYISTDSSVATVSGSTVTIVGAGTTTLTASQAGNADFNAAANVNQTLTVSKAVAGVTLSGLAAAFDGQPKAVGVTTSPAGLPVSVTYDGGATVPSAAGSYAVVATVNAPNHVGSATGTLVIGKATQTITFAPLAQRVFATGDSFTLGATASSGLAVSYASSNSAVATVSGNTVTVVGVGTTTITASQAGNANFNAATNVTQPLDIVLAIQTITFAGTELAGKKFGDAPFNLTATAAPSGLTVAFASSDPSVATVSGNTVTILKAGSTDITATQAGNSNFGPAVPVVRALVVAKAQATVTLAGLTHTFNNTAKSASATTTPSSLTVDITYAGTGSPSTPPVNAGSYGVTATINDINYAGTATGNLVIDKAPQTITFASIPAKTFGDADFDLTATSDSGLPVALASGTPAVATVTGNTVKLLAGGTTTITASQAGNANYLPAPSVPRDLVVAKAAATVTLGSATLAQTYTGTPRVVTATTTPSDLPVLITFAQGGNPVAAPINAGSYDVTAVIQDPRYQGTATGTLVVAKADQTITFGALDSKPLDLVSFVLGATSSSNLPVSYATSNNTPKSGNPSQTVATVTGTNVALQNVGTITITATQAGDANYNAATAVSQVLTVLNQSQTVAFDAAQLPAKTFGNAPFNISATSNRGLLVGFVSSNPAVATVAAGTLSGNVTTAQVTIVGAGSADITAKQPGDDNNAAAPDVTRTLTVAKASATVTLADLAATFDGGPKAATATSNPAGLNIVIEYAGTVAPPAPPVNAGTYAVTATIQESNYSGSATGNLVIAKAAQSITFPAGSVGSPRLIDAAPFPLTAAATSALPVSIASSNPAVATISGNTTAGFTVNVVGLGNTTLTATQAGDANFLAATAVTQVLTVNPVAPVIVATPSLNQTTVRGSAFVFGPSTLNARSAPATFSINNAPLGLVVDPASGAISGKAEAEGTFAIELKASNVTGFDTRTLNLVVQPPAPVIKSPAAVSVLAGGNLTYTMVTDPAVGSSGLTVSATGMPGGVTFNPATGLLSGTAPGFPVNTTVTLTATNATGSATLPLRLTVNPNPDSPVYGGPASASATAGVAFSFTPLFSASTATPATPTTFAVTSGSLPTGLGPISASTGAITGTPSQTGTFRIEITATRGALTGVASITLVVNPAATAPVVSIQNGNVRSATVGGNFTSGNITATPSAGATIAVGSLPPGLVFNSGATPPTITGSPTSVGTYNITLNATSSAGTGPNTTLSLTVAPHPQAPVLTSDPVVSGRVGVPFVTYTLLSNPAATSYAATSSLPPGLSLNPTTGEITGTPTERGTTRVFFTGSNANGTSLGLELTFNIAPPLTVPVVNSNGSAQAQVGQSFTYAIIASNSPTSYAATGLPAGLTLNTTTGIISGVPSTTSGSTPYGIDLSATNGDGTGAVKRLSLTVNPAPATPVISSGATATARVGTAFTYNITATESPTSFVAENVPAGLAVNPTTGVISGTPLTPGSVDTTVAAANAAGLGAGKTVVFTIAPALSAPSITSSASSVGRVGETFSYQIAALPAPITGYGMSVGLKESLPTGLVFNSATGLISGTPTEPGTRVVTLTATGAGGTSLPQPLTITINPAAGVPVVTSAGSASGTVGVAFTYNITADAPPSAPVTSRDAVNLPEGLAVNPFTGVISGSPTTVGTKVATLVAANANGTGPSRDLSITIQPSPTAPVVTAGSANARAGTAFAHQIVATGSPTSYEVIGAPAWMAVDNATGAIAGTPPAPGQVSVFLLARNSAGVSGPALLTVNIAAAAGTPVITSSRTGSGTVGAAFVALPVMADPAATSFSAVGLPPGLVLEKIDPTNWAIRGTPTTSGPFVAQVWGINAAGIGAAAEVKFQIGTSITFGSN